MKLIILLVFVANISGIYYKHHFVSAQNNYGDLLMMDGINLVSNLDNKLKLIDVNKELSGYYKTLIENNIKDSISDLFMRETKDNGMHSECRRELIVMLYNHNTMWVHMMLDALGKPSSGLLSGSLTWPGDYDECLAAHGEVNDGNETTVISGRYCMVSLQVKKTAFPFKWGVCVPSSCDSDDVVILLNDTLHMTRRIIGDSLDIGGALCNPDYIPWTSGAIICVVVLSLIGALIVMGTVYDILSSPMFWTTLTSNSDKNTINNEETPLLAGEVVVIKKSGLPKASQSKWAAFLMCFSLYNNTKKLFNTSQRPNTVKAIDGFRVLSLAWVIYGHTTIFGMAVTRNIATAMQTEVKKLSMQPVLNSFYSVDSFFFMSGVLVTFHMLRLLKENADRVRSVKTWVMFYLHRYIRLTPFYMLILMIYLCLSRFWSTGPFYIPQPPDYEICRDKWWTNILYINNFYNLTDTCMAWSWYLANDMQFHIVSPPIIVGFFLKPVVGFLILGALLMEQFIYRGVVSADLNLPLGEVFFNQNLTIMQDMQGSWVYFYTAPYARIAPYLIGMLTGYALYRYRTRLPRAVVLINWALTITVIFSLLYGTYPTSQGHPASEHVNAFFNAINKTLWGLAIGWIIYASNVGYGGMAGEFLSWRGWSPIARLTYAAYLIHPIVIEYYVANMRTTYYYEAYSLVYLFFGHWVMTYMFAYIVSMCLEAPLLGLEKILLPR